MKNKKNTNKNNRSPPDRVILIKVIQLYTAIIQVYTVIIQVYTAKIHSDKYKDSH